MQDDQTTAPTPLPPAAQAPYPAHPAPQPRVDLPVAKKNNAEAAVPTALGALGITLIGGAVAGAIGLLIAGPLLARKAKPEPKARTRRTRKARD
ncbi:hypothetical protein [uncultured Sphingomonas sp.]|uniref:hypothetical protein n=1 Tax=uncultured Sphingomonas sp. TaxID=158754 RepID=UPI0025D8F729|nr:hypothetical protein [uncultured Sphingomonas sp.]